MEGRQLPDRSRQPCPVNNLSLVHGGDEVPHKAQMLRRVGPFLFRAFLFLMYGLLTHRCCCCCCFCLSLA